MATSFRSVLWEVALDQQGFVTSQDARRLGIPVIELGKLASRGKLEHVSYGIYRFPELPVTPLSSYMEATLWPGGRGVLSHDTALELYELCDINPTRIHICISKTGRYTPRRTGAHRYDIHRMDLAPQEITHFEEMPIVRPATAVRQCIESGVQGHLIAQAIDKARAVGSITAADEHTLISLMDVRE